MNKTTKVFLEDFKPEPFTARGITVTLNLEDADLAIIRLATPFQTLHPNFLFGGMQHEGDLDFKQDRPGFTRLRELAAVMPTIVVVEMDRPAIITNIEPLSPTLLAAFGGNVEALIDLLLDNALSGGALPFELPESMDAVAAKAPDAPALPGKAR